MRVAFSLNKVHGGGMLPWLFSLTPFALCELHRVTMAWLDETQPEAEGA
jgi:hypothetical protein